MAITKTTILITGGAGFIGTNLCEYFLSKGYFVVCFDNFSTGKRTNIEHLFKHPKFQLLEGDIRNLNNCKNACDGVDFVLHQAALGSVPRSIEDPITTNDVNTSGFLNMLVAARDAKVKRFVYAASSSTYGDSKGLPKIEDTIGKPLSPYAITKYVNELYADIFNRTYGLNTIGLRYFNVFGKRQDPNGAYAAVIPKWVDSILNNEDVYINGDGETSRDFCYIKNTVQMNIRLVAVDPGTYYFDDLTWTFQVPAGNTTLTTNIVGSGTVSKSPDQSTYTPSTTVTLTPLPTTHWSFSNWSGDLTGNANPASVLMDVDKNITANFAIDPSFNFDWLFNVDGNLEGWSIDPQLNVTSHTGGSVTLTPTANQFARFSLFDFPITASTYNKMTITLQNNSATTDQLGIVVGTEVLTYVMSTSDASIQTYEINMTDFASWTGDVTTLRIRFADADNVNGAKPSDNGSIIIDDIILSFDPALSIENNELKQSISLYPNPTTNLLNIDTNENILKSEIKKKYIEVEKKTPRSVTLSGLFRATKNTQGEGAIFV